MESERMEKTGSVSRRDMLGKFMPACALTCLLPRSGAHQEVHPFEATLKRPITYRQAQRLRYTRDYIPIMKGLSGRMGKDTLLEWVKEVSFENNVDLGNRLRERLPDDRLSTLMGGFRRPDPEGMLANTTLWEVVEDSEDSFEIRVSECLQATIFREAGEWELGYATICHADYGLPVGFNPQIELVRSKTLMEGHDCCNHRYVLRT